MAERQERSRERQAAQLELTGFINDPELAHAAEMLLRRAGWSRTDAEYGGHLCAPGNRNFQGQPRLAAQLGRSVRTCQRARAKLEAAGLITSYCLEPGDQLDEMRAPVHRPMTVRDVTVLRTRAQRRLVWARWKAHGGPPPPRRQRSAVDAAPATADELADVAARVQDPELARLVGEIARAHASCDDAVGTRAPLKPRNAEPATPCSVPPGCPATIDPAEIDAWDRVTAELEQSYRERGPP